MTSESVRRGAFICQECYATSFDTEPEAVKHENAYGHSTVWSPAVGKAVQKFAEPESKELKLTLHTLGGVRDHSYRLDIITDEERRFAKLTLSQFAALLAGDQIKVQAER